MRAAWIIAAMEWRRMFATPLAWLTLAVAGLVQGLVFGRLVRAYARAPVVEGETAGVTYHTGSLLLGATAYLGLLLIPLLAMRSFAAERQAGTWPLLAGAPVRSGQIVAGKFVALAAVAALMTAMATLMPASLGWSATHLDPGVLGAAWLGGTLLLAAYASLSLLMAAWSPTPAVAAVLSVAVLALFWILELLASTGIQWLDAAMAYLSLLGHLEPMLRGLVAARDVSYYLIFIGLSLGLCGLRVEGLRDGP